MRIVSIIMGAYQCSSFIRDSVNSVLNQTLPEGWELELLVGVDGCPETLEVVKTIQHPSLTIYEMDQNYGTYIVANTLIQQARGEIIARVDADDKVKPDRIAKIIFIFESRAKVGMVNTYYESWYVKLGVKVEDVSKTADGVWAFRKEILDKAGGYMPWLCAADSELIDRLKFWGVPRYVIPEFLYIRQSHPNSLTTKGETRNGSPLRTQYKDNILHNRGAYKKGVSPEQITPETGRIKNVIRS